MSENSLMITAVRATLTKIGTRITPSQMYWIERVISQLEVGRWFRARGYPMKPLYACREQLYTALARGAALARGIADERVLYLEFGVFRGDSLRVWSRLLRNPLTQLHGFDSFEGLPENWNAHNPEGKFHVRGALPRFVDPRVTLHQGWFNETLPGFVLPPHERLIIHIDADLYSSAKYVLDTLKDAIRPGTFVLFDEFYDRDHELRAFSEFLDTTGMTFRFLGGATQLSQCAFERVS